MAFEDPLEEPAQKPETPILLPQSTEEHAGKSKFKRKFSAAAIAAIVMFIFALLTGGWAYIQNNEKINLTLTLAEVELRINEQRWAEQLQAGEQRRTEAAETAQRLTSAGIDSSIVNTIMSDLRIMKSAILMYYVDNGNFDGFSKASFVPYITEDIKFNSPAYLLRNIPRPGGDIGVDVWVGFDLIAAGVSESVKELLGQEARESGLLAAPDRNSAPYAGQDTVWMLGL